MKPESQKSGTHFLATTALDNFWDVSGRVVFLGEWCRRYSNRDAWRSLDADVFEDLWGDPARRAQAYTEIKQVYERLLPKVALALNEVHQVSHGTQYWRLVAGNWLYYYLSVLFDRYSHLTSALERYPGIKTVVLAPRCHVIPNDSLETMRWVCTDSYNLQIYSRILDAIGLHGYPEVAIEQEVTPIPSRQRTGGGRIGALLRRLSSRFTRWLGRRRTVLYKSYFARSSELLLALRSKGAVVPFIASDDAIPRMEPNTGLRQQIAQVLTAQGAAFESLALTLLPHDIPVCFVENFAAVTRHAAAYPATPRAILSANGWAYDEVFKQWAAACAEEGTLLLCVQHGGGYTGIGTFSPYEHFEISIADRYYSWGWRPAGGCDKVLPMAAPYLMRTRPMPAQNRKSNILYLATAESRYIFSLQGTASGFAKYLEWQETFMTSLHPALKRQVRARLFPDDQGWDIRERWDQHSPECQFDDGAQEFLASLDDCRLFVCDHLGTTFYEAMAAGKPMICYFDPNANPLTPRAEAVMDELRLAGIVFDTPQGAAEAVLAVYPDVEGWWNQQTRQAARDRFVREYARVGEQPLSDWLTELASVVSSAQSSRAWRCGH